MKHTYIKEFPLLLISIDTSEPISPPLGIEGIVVLVMLRPIPFEEGKPYEGRKADDEQVKPAEHSGLFRVPLLVPQYPLVVLILRREKDILPERNASSSDVILVMIARLLRPCNDPQKKAREHLRETP